MRWSWPQAFAWLCLAASCVTTTQAAASEGGSGLADDQESHVGGGGAARGLLDRQCGDRGLPCCDIGERCHAKVTGDFDFIVCSSPTGGGTCVSCGGTGEPCCQPQPDDEPFCSQRHFCSSGTCAPCGERGEPCCVPRAGAFSNANRCFADTRHSMLACSSDDGPGTCEACGGAGEPCCQLSPTDDPFCYRGNLCSAGSCTPCGSPGEPCCEGVHDFQRCLTSQTSNPLRCDADMQTCEVCGGVGEPCCQRISTRDPTCHKGNVCTSGGCAACGERGEACCAGASDAQRCHASALNLLTCGADRSNAEGTCVECGGPGQPCCQPRARDEPFCSDGGTCSGGVCSDSSVADRECGENGQPCCPGKSNRDFCPRHKLSCSSDTGDGTCEGCGGTGELCCQTLPSFTPSCDDFHVCSGGRCEPCGAVGEVCCEGRENNEFCPLAFHKRCSAADGNGTCVACGGAGEPCCQQRSDDAPSCDAGHTCAAGQCEPCGEVGEACCPGREHADFCPIGRHKRCSSDDGDGVCIACGGTGEPCCQRLEGDEPGCDRGNTCVAGECRPCGERGERCCKGYHALCPSTDSRRCSSADGDGVCL